MREKKVCKTLIRRFDSAPRLHAKAAPILLSRVVFSCAAISIAFTIQGHRIAEIELQGV